MKNELKDNFEVFSFLKDLSPHSKKRAFQNKLVNIMEDIGTRFDQHEILTKEKLDDAIALLDAWDENQKKLNALKAYAQKNSISFETARKKFKLLPEFNYDVVLAQKKRSTLEADVEKLRSELTQYDPSVGDFSYKRKSGQRTTDDKQMPDENSDEIIEFSSVEQLVWYDWPIEVKKSGLSYGSKSAGSDSDASSGVGPGEEWLAYIFGGKVQGGSVSYDVVTKDGKAWEVKQLLTRSETIRPGTEGLKEYSNARAQLEKILTQLNEFSKTALSSKYAKFLSQTDKKRIEYISEFIDVEYEMIINKGEFPVERQRTLRAVMKVASLLKKQFMGNETLSKKKITLDSGREISLEHEKYYQVIKNVENIVGKTVIQSTELLSVLSSILSDAAFNNPTLFLDTWVSLIKPGNVFAQTDGVFVVNPRGYLLVPKNMINDAFKFVNVSQGVPKFSLRAEYW
jgi:hypothetical protein